MDRKDRIRENVNYSGMEFTVEWNLHYGRNVNYSGMKFTVECKLQWNGIIGLRSECEPNNLF